MIELESDGDLRMLEDELLAKLDSVSVALHPKAVRAVVATDGLGEDAWRLELTLPKPEGLTWDPDEVFDLRRKALGCFAELVDGTEFALPGRTLATITTDEAPEEETALDETPEDGEDPATSAHINE